MPRLGAASFECGPGLQGAEVRQLEQRSHNGGTLFVRHSLASAPR